jgi:DDE family transposase
LEHELSASLETLVVAAYMFADEAAVARSGPEGLTTDAELVALSVAQASIGIVSDRQFLGLIEKLLPGWFPHLPCQSQYNRRLRRSAPLLASVQLRLAELLACGDLRLADGTLIGVANYPGCQGRSEFAGSAAYGYCPAKSQYVWGVRLVLISDRVGLPVGYTIVPANEKEYEPVRELTTAQAGCLLIADKGYWGRAYAETLALQGVTIRTPDRVRSADNLAREKHLAGLRLVIESTISNLKCQMRLERHLAKTPQGLVQRIAQRLLALTLGMLLNALHGRPPRALVADDGR